MLKLAYKNFADNKFRTLAIILTIAIAVSILFLAFCYQNIVKTQFSKAVKIEAENADIRIEYSADADSRIINTTHLSPLLDKTAMAVGVLDLYGKSYINNSVQYVNLRGIKEQSFYKLNNLTIVKSVNRPLKSDEIIIDSKTSALLNLNLDSMVEITVGSLTQRFFVATIVETHPCFNTDGAIVIYCMENTASKFVGGHFGNLYNKIFIKTAKNVDRDNFILEIKDIDEYKYYKVLKENDKSVILDKAYNASLPMIIALLSCAVFALFIVYLIVNISLKRRTLTISRLKSIGASNLYITAVFLLESFMYVLLGALIGSILCFIFIKSNFLNLASVSLKDSYYIKMLALSILTATVLFILTILATILKFSKVAVVAQYKESKNTLRKDNRFFAIISLLAFIVSISLVLPKYLDSTRGIIAFALCVISVFLLLPYLASFFFDITKNSLNKSSVYVVANNLAREKLSTNNMRIIFFAIVICTVLASSAYHTQNIKNSLIDDINCDIVIANVKSDTKKTLNEISSNTELYNIQAINIKDGFVKIDGKQKEITLLSLTPSQLENVGKITYITPKDSLKTNIDKGIALNYSYHKVYKLDIGDKISLSLYGKNCVVEITAFFNSYQFGGKLGIVSNEFLSKSFDIPIYDTVIAKTTDNVDATITKLRADFGDTNIVVLNFESLYLSYLEILTITVMLAKLFTIVIIAVCILSVIFNIINAREEKKLEIYKIYSLGFSKKQIMLMELCQNLVTVIFALVATIIVLPILSSALTNAFALGYLYIAKPLSYIACIIIGASFLLVLTLNSLTSYFIVNNKNLTKTLKQD